MIYTDLKFLMIYCLTRKLKILVLPYSTLIAVTLFFHQNSQRKHTCLCYSKAYLRDHDHANGKVGEI